ncbi:outer membrane receptor protein involved in Fe transport [Polymorphobacter multimanifer]|uniref:Outer membrane receptor protein involved in Fe transport n=1 Tax=Polymorphobacter multimanifer TaxID=1070431 RepID=A0A841LHL2_9SPHN|nr:TonB-dependent receptor [Polymorphobacter multimanifer]MBB6228692.1 outer membrane receptor protein involved in Fe transport [Polymorphobacter multimanifer]
MVISSRAAFRSAVSAFALLSVPGLLPTAAQAQEVAAAVDVDDETAIVVTGSRLRRDPNATAPLPISTLTSDDFRNAGNTDVTATLRQIPALLSSSTVADSIERGPVNGGAGQATLNLRQLGANRTLVVVDGWRHVSGVQGTQTVDVSTIPNALIERVEVLTGGASAIYGADAVTGVVNYVLKRDFEGLAIDAQSGISSRGDGQSYRIEGTLGKNFAGGRGNVTLSLGYTNDAEVLFSDREFTRDNGRGNNSTTYGNPLKRFQRGEINPSTMPNFAARFRLGGPGGAATRFPFGAVIPTAEQVATLFPGGITAAERALVDRAEAAPLFAIGADPRFAISSGAGLIFRGDFGFFNADVNGNGISDCNESYIGRTGFGGGGCYISQADGSVKVFEDGIISTGSNQFGGDGAVERTNTSSLTPGSERINGNLRASFEAAPEARLWFDAKYARNNSTIRNNYNTFYDSLLIFPDNPFIPAALQSQANVGGGLRISRDFLDLGPGITTANRDTYRIVGGVDGDLTPHLRYEFVANYGRTDNSTTFSNSVRYDRLFAAIDVIRHPVTGQPVCRSDFDPTPHPGSEIFPVIAPGFFTFRPGDGSCRPGNILRGEQSLSQAAVDFITTPTTTRARLEQTVITGLLSGDTGGFFNLPGGAVGFVAGFEYRKEKSQTTFDDLRLGLLPAGSPAGAQGTFIGDIEPQNQALIFDPSNRTRNAGGSFDVKEVFGEINLPLLRDTPFFHELTVGGAGRYANYSTVGDTFTWNVNGTWAPIRDIRFRGTYARAIRAPNIAELFDPEQGATFRPSDPCNQTQLDSLVRGNSPVAANRVANCRADGIPVGYEDPLTARFGGVSGGNVNLTEERATTWTVGAVVQPRFLPGLTLSGDYYSIRIDDAIQAVTAQNIVNTCYDLATFPNSFCQLFTRNRTPASATFLGFNFLRQTQINFARLDTSGVDFSADYRFAVGQNNIALRVAGNWTEKLDRFFDPVDQDLVNPGLRELGVPEWSGFGSVSYNRGPFSMTYGVQFVQSTAAASVIEIERIDEEFGPAGFAPDYWIHTVSFNFDATRELSFYGGVNNLTNAVPYISSSAYPVSGVGRFFFLGARVRL